MIAFIVGILIGVALALLGGWLVAGYHIWRRRGDEAEWDNRSLPYEIRAERARAAARARNKALEPFWIREVHVTDADEPVSEPCIECGEPCRGEDLQCRHGLPICADCWPNGCRLCIDDLEDDAQDAIFDGVRDAARDREECDG